MSLNYSHYSLIIANVKYLSPEAHGIGFKREIFLGQIV